MRLSLDVIPHNYQICITPDLQKFTFEGHLVIQVEVCKAVSSITLHALELQISTAKVTDSNGNQLNSVAITYNEKNQTATFVFEKVLELGKYDLEMNYTGILNDRLAGFYRSKYTVEGQDRYMGVTQFEATDARRALPCWDEPSIKATFDVIIRAPIDRVAVSNMPISKTITKISENIREYYFSKSPKMSTYLLAFVVGEFDYLSCFTSEGVEVRVYTPLGKAHLGTFALRVASKTLSYYQKLFGIPYPLPKMDLLAIPDFAAGAMENFGCITYREVALLIHEEQSSLDRKQRVARTVCHEIAHQWFGNIVTMEWWTHLWLNEGFARFLEFFAVDDLFPEWKMWTHFVVSIYLDALRKDSLESSHPIEVEVHNPEEINEIFDTISYAKGASVIRMLCNYIGSDIFFKGLNLYLTKHAWGNATTNDLWAAFEITSGKPVQEMMKTWTTQTGYPLISVTETSKGNYSISQSRFLLNGKKGQGHWMIPISVSNPKGIHDCGQFSSDTGVSLNEMVPSISNSWFKINPGQIGFYRVKYTDDQFNHLCKIVNTFSEVDRICLLGDASALAKAGHLETTRVLTLLQQFAGENEFLVWSEISSCLRGLSFLYASQPFFPLFKKYAITIFTGIAEKLGLFSPTLLEDLQKEKPDPLRMQFKSLILDLLVEFHHEKIIEPCKKLFTSHYNSIVNSNGTSLVADLRTPVYSMFVASGGEKEFNMVWDLCLKSDLSEEKRRCFAALGSATDKALLEKLLQLTISKDVRHQDIVFPFASVAGNQHGKDLCWEFFKKNWTFIDENFNKGGQNFLLGGLIGSVTSVFIGYDKIKSIQDFFSTKSVPSAEKSIRQAIEVIEVNTARIERDSKEVSAWFQAISSSL